MDMLMTIFAKRNQPNHSPLMDSEMLLENKQHDLNISGYNTLDTNLPHNEDIGIPHNEDIGIAHNEDVGIIHNPLLQCAVGVLVIATAVWYFLKDKSVPANTTKSKTHDQISDLNKSNLSDASTEWAEIINVMPTDNRKVYKIIDTTYTIDNILNMSGQIMSNRVADEDKDDCMYMTCKEINDYRMNDELRQQQRTDFKNGLVQIGGSVIKYEHIIDKKNIDNGSVKLDRAAAPYTTLADIFQDNRYIFQYVNHVLTPIREIKGVLIKLHQDWLNYQHDSKPSEVYKKEQLMRKVPDGDNYNPE